jgi:hypothetical protein
MSDNKQRYERKLSALERYNLVINEVVRYNVDGVVEGSGELDVDKWRRAVAIAAEANPGVRVRLRSFLGFSKWVDSGIAPTVEVIDAPNWDGCSEAGAHFLEDKFNPLRGDPVADIKLIPGNPARIVFRGLHAAMDARGHSQFTTDVFRVLQGKEPVGSRATITDLDIRLMHQDKVKAESAQLSSCIPPLAPPSTPEDSLRFIWRRVQLPRIVADRLPKMAIYLANHARRIKAGDVAFTIPVDFRTLRHQVNSTANLTGYIRVPVGPDDRPNDFLQALTREINDYADCRNSDLLKKLPWFPIALMKKTLAKNAARMTYTENKDIPTAGIVNLGFFDAKALWSYPGFDARRGYGIPGGVGKLNVLLHTYRDGTDVVFATPEGYNRQGQLDALIEDFKTAFV